MDFQTPTRRVLGLGAAKEGVGHWWSQRMTAVALAPLAVLSILPLGRAIGSDVETVRAIYADPFTALTLLLFVVVAFRHLHLGLQVVIEDYVHHKAARVAALFASTAFCAVFGLAGAFGVAKLAFGG
ncbi:MAG: succinate dehydrogenase, hydrophobic membrane anchor protein [Rubrimonas sp.]|uniref:succinate dehydrogenase, hydrophobic membrane anchor protein n=1 Tax=Rubrimonas sp. TaxID=2036015 RepID=UPI002FDE4CFC